ncbi:hypothetical protein DSL72_001047 [Monilinia vaccinii-corymbosi]|uniref:Uncharacterized protein n=1 Tax=Monilinia vaccinii-corymbosi TaxID=61207 RepID=A0A8A3P325_9HELO|nr:hypothetical protein DSL72_001047 [Monilinia vaccinii-corymbosi]
MPPITASLPSLGSAAALVIKSTTDTDLSSNTSQPMNCNDPNNSLDYTSIECQKLRKHDILIVCVLVFTLVTMILVAFWIIWGSFMKKAQEQTLGSNTTLRLDEIMEEGGNDAPPSYSMDVRTAEEGSPSPPAYTPGLEGLPSYTLLGQAVDPVTLQPINPPLAAVLNGIIHSYPELMDEGEIWRTGS